MTNFDINPPSPRPVLLRTFVLNEVPYVLLGTFWGIVTAAVVHVLVYDHPFHKYLNKLWTSAVSMFDDPRILSTYVLLALILLAGYIAFRFRSLLSRGLRSWSHGVTSGLQLLSFIFTASLIPTQLIHLRYRILADLGAITISTLIGYYFYRRRIRTAEHIPTEQDVLVSSENKNAAGKTVTESDEPIQNWSEDTIGRAALVDTLSIKLLISKAPVIALFGDFGSGKTSVLNLLRSHLLKKAIVVSFSPWLPGSQEALASYLMADIASESQKQFMVPGLRKSTERIAKALSQSVPILKGLPELLPASTQRDDIENLRQILMRLPQRIIVLLDELDRMQKDELITLLKVVRGFSSLPNLSFVCAAERNTLMETVCGNLRDESNTYFEKFFPIAIPIPKLDDDKLQRAGIERLIRSLQQRRWFVSVVEEKALRKRLEDAWDTIAPFVRTLRAVGLLANDVSVAAAPLYREVDAIDLVFVELLRRFQPNIYELISRNGLALTGGESILRGGGYRTEEEQKQALLRFKIEIKTIIQDETVLEHVRRAIGKLFPRFEEDENKRFRKQPTAHIEEKSEDKRISNPSMFPAYFRYELPQAVFSTVELEGLISESSTATNQIAQREILSAKLRSMEKGSLQRDDFLRKLAESVYTINLQIARSWILAVLTFANDLTYDIFSAFGEGGHVIRMVIRVAERLPHPERLVFLSECILESTDDTIPVRILTLLTNPESDGYQQISFAELYPTFIKRMHSRYGLKVDATKVDLKTSDTRSFDVWSADDLSQHNLKFDPEERLIQYDFWRRYIGASKSKLITTFNENIMPPAIYSADPEPFVRRKVDIDWLRDSFVELPNDEEMKNVPAKYTNRMQRFLNGAFRDGIAFPGIENE